MASELEVLFLQLRNLDLSLESFMARIVQQLHVRIPEERTEDYHSSSFQMIKTSKKTYTVFTFLKIRLVIRLVWITSLVTRDSLCGRWPSKANKIIVDGKHFITMRAMI